MADSFCVLAAGANPAEVMDLFTGGATPPKAGYRDVTADVHMSWCALQGWSGMGERISCTLETSTEDLTRLLADGRIHLPAATGEVAASLPREGHLVHVKDRDGFCRVGCYASWGVGGGDGVDLRRVFAWNAMHPGMPQEYVGRDEMAMALYGAVPVGGGCRYGVVSREPSALLRCLKLGGAFQGIIPAKGTLFERVLCGDCRRSLQLAERLEVPDTRGCMGLDEPLRVCPYCGSVLPPASVAARAASGVPGYTLCRRSDIDDRREALLDLVRQVRFVASYELTLDEVDDDDESIDGWVDYIQRQEGDLMLGVYECTQ